MLRAVSGSGSSGVGTGTNLQIVGAYGRISNSTRGGASGGRQDIRFESRIQTRLAGVKISDLRLAFFGGWRHNGSSGEVTTGFNFQVESAFESTSPAYYKINTINGQKLATLGALAPLYITDYSGFSADANADIYARIGLVVGSVSAIFPAGTPGSASRSGDANYLSYAPTSQVYATGAISNPTSFGGASAAGAYPAATLGVPASSIVSAVNIGDSITTGNNDTTDTNGNIGYLNKALYTGKNSSIIPWANLSVGSNTAAIEATSVLKRALWPYATHITIALGTNDIASGRSAALVQADLTTLCTAAKQTLSPYGRPLHVTLMTIAPRTTSTDSWATAANQTAVANFGVGGVRDTVNTWIKAQAGTSLVDAVFDVNPIWEDQANPSKWVTTGAANYATSDGVHPSPAVHTLQATAFNTSIQGWSV
jgi:lysophospholipase L1-like esterase